ncbi:MAG: hypothetical protein WCT32_04670 [Patescibacteria group bacterium]|jgi:hypothetical protein
MKKIISYKKVARVFVTLATIFSLLLPISAATPTFAVGPDQPVGPQGPVGPQVPVGPQGPVGPQTDGEIQTQTATSGATADPVITESNNVTGPDSTNTNQTSSNSETNIENINDANIENQTTLTANTGKNDIGKNTVTGDVSTGSINGSVNVINIANSELAPGSTVGSQTVDGSQTGQIVLNPINQRSDLSNTSTGPDSTNNNTVSSNNIIKVVDQNNAEALNNLVIDANTGQNNIGGNTKIGDVTTGNINLSANLINLLNVMSPNLTLTLDIWSVLGNFSGDIILSNGTTGPQSNNENSINTSDSTAISTTNNSTIDNVFNFQTNTGGNTTDSGTAIGNVSTGEAKVQSSTTNVANLDTPVLYLINVFGEWDGALDGVDPNSVIINTMTGPGSTNFNEKENNQSVDITTENNASASNIVTVKANTGDNHVGKNTVTGNLKTGSINVTASAVNILNSFGDNAKNLILKVINIFGNWKGNVAKQPKPANSNGGSNNQVPGGTSQNNPTPATTSTESPQAPTTNNESTPAMQSTAAIESSTGSTTSNNVSANQNSQKPAQSPVNKLASSTRRVLSSEQQLPQTIDEKMVPTENSVDTAGDFSGVVLAATDEQLPLGGSRTPLVHIALSALGITLLWGLVELLARYSRGR